MENMASEQSHPGHSHFSGPGSPSNAQGLHPYLHRSEFGNCSNPNADLHSQASEA